MSNNNFSWPVEAPFIQQRTVIAQEIDGFGHVNNARYIDWANEVAWAHSTELGLPFEAYQRLGVGCVVWRHEFDYLAAAMLDDELAIATWISANDNRVRLRRSYEMRRCRDGAILFRGQTLFVTINMQTGKPARMPKEFIEGYRPSKNKS